MTKDKIVVITGAGGDISAYASRRLRKSWHHIVIVGDSPRKTSDVARAIGADHFVVDFTRLDEVRELAIKLNLRYPRIDVLANNEYSFFGDYSKTVDGFERNLQVNYLAPFLLTWLLIEKLMAARASVVHTSSAYNRLAYKLDVHALEHDWNYSALQNYSASMLKNILFTRELHRRYNAQGISAAAFGPGNIVTNFAANSETLAQKFTPTNRVVRYLQRTEQDADQLVRLAEGQPGVDWESGTYYERGKPAKIMNHQAHDIKLARDLWSRTEDFLGLVPGNRRIPAIKS